MNTPSKIHMLSGPVANDIRQSYTGGSTDMYIPNLSNNIIYDDNGNMVNIEDKKIYAYDVNSLYPFVMKSFKYPIGKPTYFKGDITKVDPNAFGFFYCNIISPKNLNIPILQTHHKMDVGMRTISPLGSWSGMYFSEELYNARKFGYQFEVLWGYTFKSDYIFKGYVDTLYNLRLSYPKTNPMNMVAKLLLNSLYGRFGMDDSFTSTQIINKKDYPKQEKQPDFKESLVDFIDLGDSYLLQLKNPKSLIKTNLDNGFEKHNVNIAIACSVTAYARIHMSQFKYPLFLLENNLNLYYSDTDSLYFDNSLPSNLVNHLELGKLKLEGVYDQAVFLAPKVYALKNKEEEIIKIKGLTKRAIENNNINLNSLSLLLNKDYNLTIKQNKWFKSLEESNIEILEQIYTLKITNNKRILFYNNNNILIKTSPFIIKI